MTEYEDLIARLRNRSGVRTSDVNERVVLMDEAASALEAVAVERDNWKLSAGEAERAEKRAEKRAEEAERERDALQQSITELEPSSSSARIKRLERTAEETKRAYDQLAAVVERAKGWATRRVPGFTVENQMAEVEDALMEAPSVALDRVKADALREAADAFEGGTINVEIFGDSAETRYWQGVDEARGNLVASLRERADRIEKGESND